MRQGHHHPHGRIVADDSTEKLQHLAISKVIIRVEFAFRGRKGFAKADPRRYRVAGCGIQCMASLGRCSAISARRFPVCRRP